MPHLPYGVFGLSRRGGLREHTRSTGQATTFLGGLGLSALAFVGGRVRPLRALPAVYSFDDHGPQRYITALTPPDVQNEFGD